MSKTDGFARLLMEKASEIEFRRQEKIKRKQIEEERKRWLHEQAVFEAEDELAKYTELIEKAKEFLDESSVEAEKCILKDLHKQLESNPHFVARETRAYRKLLESQLKKAKEKAEQKKEEAWRMQKSLEAIVKILAYQNQLEKDLRDVSWLFQILRLRSIADPKLEQFICKSLNVQSLDEAESRIKQIHLDGCMELARKELNGNPYSWYALYMTA
ncbi:MAG: hypothetical protein QXN87_08895 [Candidatus Bathyarchaeia archaeon]